MRRTLFVFAIAATVTMSVTLPILAEFPGTDVMLPVVARIQGSGNPPPQFYSTVWFTDLSTTNSASIQLQFYQRDSVTNPTATASLTLSPGETRRIDDAITTFFQLSGVAGSLRVTSTEDVLVSTRNYDLPAGGTEKDTTGQYFGAIPVDFAIGSGEVTQLQGVEQTTEARYNFGAVEITGQSVTLHAMLLNPNGSTIGSKDYPLAAYGQMQKNVTDITSAINGVGNALLQISVTSGNGKILAYGTHNTNTSQDGTGFEMAFKQSLLSGSGGLSAVNHDASLRGDGTGGNPLGIANGGVGATQLANGAVGTTQLADSAVATNELANGAVTKAKLAPAGGTAGQVLGTDGTNLTWQTDGLTLPYTGTANTPTSTFVVTNSGTGPAINGNGAGTGAGLYGLSQAGAGVGGISLSGVGVVGSGGGYPGIELPNTAGVFGFDAQGDGVFGSTQGSNAAGVHGESPNQGVWGVNTVQADDGCLGCPAAGVIGRSHDSSLAGVLGTNLVGGIGVSGTGYTGVYGSAFAATDTGVWGSSPNGIGVHGESGSNDGVYGYSTNGYGVSGVSGTGYGVYGKNTTTNADGCLGCGPAGVIGYKGQGSYAGQFSGDVLVSTLASSSISPVYATAQGVLELPSSDGRLKKNVADLSLAVDALAAVQRLRGVTFNFDTSIERACSLGDERQIGMIAQEVEAVLPELVATDKEGYKSLDYAKLTPVLVEAIKEQQAIIAEQRVTIEEQRTELDQVNERVTRIEALLAESAAHSSGSAAASPR
ncbi:MAG: tail fiber domain-containing protein [Thermoanaerobaculales bacterium]